MQLAQVRAAMRNAGLATSEGRPAAQRGSDAPEHLPHEADPCFEASLAALPDTEPAGVRPASAQHTQPRPVSRPASAADGLSHAASVSPHAASKASGSGHRSGAASPAAARGADSSSSFVSGTAAQSGALNGAQAHPAHSRLLSPNSQQQQDTAQHDSTPALSQAASPASRHASSPDTEPQDAASDSRPGSAYSSSRTDASQLEAPGSRAGSLHSGSWTDAAQPEAAVSEAVAVQQRKRQADRAEDSQQAPRRCRIRAQTQGVQLKSRRLPRAVLRTGAGPVLHCSTAWLHVRAVASTLASNCMGHGTDLVSGTGKADGVQASLQQDLAQLRGLLAALSTNPTLQQALAAAQQAAPGPGVQDVQPAETEPLSKQPSAASDSPAAASEPQVEAESDDFSQAARSNVQSDSEAHSVSETDAKSVSGDEAQQSAAASEQAGAQHAEPAASSPHSSADAQQLPSHSGSDADVALQSQQGGADALPKDAAHCSAQADTEATAAPAQPASPVQAVSHPAESQLQQGAMADTAATAAPAQPASTVQAVGPPTDAQQLHQEGDAPDALPAAAVPRELSRASEASAAQIETATMPTTASTSAAWACALEETAALRQAPDCSFHSRDQVRARLLISLSATKPA